MYYHVLDHIVAHVLVCYLPHHIMGIPHLLKTNAMTYNPSSINYYMHKITIQLTISTKRLSHLVQWIEIFFCSTEQPPEASRVVIHVPWSYVGSTTCAWVLQTFVLVKRNCLLVASWPWRNWSHAGSSLEEASHVTEPGHMCHLKYLYRKSNIFLRNTDTNFDVWNICR